MADEWTVYCCADCGGWHRQLFLLEHDDECNDGSDWFVTTKPRPFPLATAAHRQEEDNG